MTLLESIFLGLVQGLTEFLPVSSSGHLVLFQHLFGIRENVLLFDIAVHIGTLIPVLIIFRSEVMKIIRFPVSRLTLLLIAGTIPTGLIGVLFKKQIEELFTSGSAIGFGFLATGFVLWAAESLKRRKKELHSTSWLDAVFVGIMQGIAIMPAVSRSGLTIAGSLFRGFDREWAARFSFLLSVPAILGAAVLHTKDLLHDGGFCLQINPLIIAAGVVVASVSGYVSIKIMLKVLTSGSMRMFSIYLWVLGTLIVIDKFFTQFYF
jgi:undecaprenyl-diphosphatase